MVYKTFWHVFSPSAGKMPALCAWILPLGNVQINLTLPSLIRTLASPKILRLGKNASELAFFSRLIRIFNIPDDIYLGINDLEENRVKKAMDK